MVGNIYGEDHPAILSYNGNLITCLSVKLNKKDVKEEEKEEAKKLINQIIDKNQQISEKTYGLESIHLLYYMSSSLTNRIALGEITTPTQANPTIKQMRLIITKFHGNDPRKLSNQLFFQQQLLYAQMLENQSQSGGYVAVELKRIAMEIYSFVLGAQVKYCKLNVKHPFLEGTYMNLAIFNRSLKQFGESLMMWKRLEQLQKFLYGDDNMSLLYTYKNIGTCYLGIG
jgi:hypothetical protein